MNDKNIDVRNSVLSAGSLGFTPTAGASAITTELGAGLYKTVIAVTDFTKAVTNANICWGVLLGTFPKGVLHVSHAYLTLTYASSDTQTTAAEIGLGTVIGTGAQATIGAAGATMEDIVDGTTATVFNGTTEVTYTFVANGQVDNKDGATTAKTLNLNFAGAWEATRTVSYSDVTVTIIWTLLDR